MWFRVMEKEATDCNSLIISALATNNGKTCKTVRLNKVSFKAFQLTAPVDAIRMVWGGSNVVFQVTLVWTKWNMIILHLSGLKNNKASPVIAA